MDVPLPAHNERANRCPMVHADVDSARLRGRRLGRVFQQKMHCPLNGSTRNLRPQHWLCVEHDCYTMRCGFVERPRHPSHTSTGTHRLNQLPPRTGEVIWRPRITSRSQRPDA